MSRIPIYIRFCIGVLVCSFALVSCHSSKQTVRWEDDIYTDHSDRGKKGGYSHPEVEAGNAQQRVIDVACSWIGVPYRYGGNSRFGVDCSGLVCVAFEKGADIKLPRSSYEQADFCKKVSRDKIQPGDLIFFTSKKGGSRINHVAIYLGENKIVHATSSRGVIISSLDDEYWHSHFHCCGRVL